MRLTAFSFAIVFLAVEVLAAAEVSHYQLILNLMSKEKNLRREAADKLLGSKDAHLVPALVDVLFFVPHSYRGEVIHLLREFTGENPGDRYYDWVEYIGRRVDLKSPPGYLRFKATLLSQIDPGYMKILYTGAPLKIRAEEILWGGVKLDGIPSLDKPAFVDASQARLKKEEKIFGLTLNGQSRAYPLRYLSWHEMLNDQIAGEPFTISF